MDTATPSPLDMAAQSDLRDQINAVLAKLTDRERRVISQRFGLTGGRSRTLEEVGLALGVTRERIRQMEARALRRLRHPQLKSRLSDFY